MMSISTQKKISFVPIVNLAVCLICWMRMYMKNNIGQKRLIKVVLKLFAVMLIVTVPRIILSKVFGNDLLDQILFYVLAYVQMLGMSWVAIVDQKRYAEKMGAFMRVIVAKEHYDGLMQRLKDVEHSHGISAIEYRCQDYWKMPDKYEMTITVSPCPTMSFSEWTGVYQHLFRQEYGVKTDELDQTPQAVLYHFTPYPSFETADIEQYFVMFYIPQTCIADWDHVSSQVVLPSKQKGRF